MVCHVHFVRHIFFIETGYAGTVQLEKFMVILQAAVTALVIVFLFNLVRTVYRVRQAVKNAFAAGRKQNTSSTVRRFTEEGARIEDAEFTEIEPPSSRKG